MTDRTGKADAYLHRMAKQIGATSAVLASDDGLLVAGAGADRDGLEELAAYAPSGLPQKFVRPEGMSRTRVEVNGERLYLATIDAKAPVTAARELASILSFDLLH